MIIDTMQVRTDIAMLREKCRPLGGAAIRGREDTLAGMRDVLVRTGGIGLAAIQVGIPERFFIVTHPFEAACFNPKVLEASTETEEDREGCLSLPGEVYLVHRSTWIEAGYTNAAGNGVRRRLEGLAARVFLHELDHLDGTLICDRGVRVEEPDAPR